MSGTAWPSPTHECHLQGFESAADTVSQALEEDEQQPTAISSIMNGKVVCLVGGGAEWNTEHTWCKALFSLYTACFNLRACLREQKPGHYVPARLLCSCQVSIFLPGKRTRSKIKDEMSMKQVLRVQTDACTDPILSVHE